MAHTQSDSPGGRTGSDDYDYFVASCSKNTERVVTGKRTATVSSKTTQTVNQSASSGSFSFVAHGDIGLIHRAFATVQR